MTEREEVIDNLDKVWHYIMKQSNSTHTGAYTIMRYTDYITDAIKLLKKYDVTPEELERLKQCRHNCKIDCLLEKYNAALERLENAELAVQHVNDLERRIKILESITNSYG